MAVDPSTPVRILTRNDIPSRWFAANPELGKGELALETNQAGNVTGLKVGTGTTPWNQLEYVTLPVNAFQPRTEGYQIVAVSNTLVLAEKAQFILYVSVDGVIVKPDTAIPETDYVLQPDRKTIIFQTALTTGRKVVVTYIADGLDLNNLRVLDQGYITFDIEPGGLAQRYTYALPYKFIITHTVSVGLPVVEMRIDNIVRDYLVAQTVDVGSIVDVFVQSNNPQSCVTFRIDKFDAILIPSNPSPGSASNSKSTKTKNLHGFVKGDVLIDSPTGYIAGLATNVVLAEIVGMVESVVDVNNFVLVTGGEINTSGLNLAAGNAYFLSHTNAGKLSANPPPDLPGYVRKCVVIGGKDNNSYFVNFLGLELGLNQELSPADVSLFIPKIQKGQPGGVVPLNNQSIIDPIYLPPGSLIVDQTIIDGSANSVANNAVFDALALKQNLLTAGTNITIIGGVIASSGGGTGITDGDKGDLTVSGAGATWTIDNDVVTFAKFQNVNPGILLGRSAGTVGDVQQITIGANLTLDAATNTLSGAAPGNGTGTGVTDGDKTDIVVSATGTVWSVKAARILNQALTGLAPVAGEATAADTILQAISKILNFIQGIAATVRNTVLTGVDVNLPGTVAATDSVLQAAGKLQRQATENNALGRLFNISVDFAGLATSSAFIFDRKFAITSPPATARIATITYRVNAGVFRTTIANANIDIAATSGNFELTMTVTFASGQNAGVANLSCLYA